MTVFMPMMNPEAVQIFNDLLANRKPELCFEWGSGGSTNYFPKNHPCIKKWVSMENLKRFYDRIKPHVSSVVDLRFEPDGEKYVRAILNEPHKFDFIFVDGRWRGNCLWAASKMVKPKTGRVILHDSGRPKYWPAFKYFDHAVKLQEGDNPLPTGGCKCGGITIFFND